MCSGIIQNKVTVRPGKSLKYRTVEGVKRGVFGLGGGNGSYNARVENLDRTWGKLKGNRAVVEVDYFMEQGVAFRKVDGDKLHLAAIYDDFGDLALLTQPSTGEVKQIHARMPVFIINDERWMEQGALVTFHDIETFTPDRTEPAIHHNLNRK